MGIVCWNRCITIEVARSKEKYVPCLVWQNGIKFIFKGIYFTPEFCISFGFVWLKTLSWRDPHSLDIFSIICSKLCECTQRNSIIATFHCILFYDSTNKSLRIWQHYTRSTSTMYRFNDFIMFNFLSLFSLRWGLSLVLAFR